MPASEDSASRYPSRATTLPSNTGVVVLDTDLTPELEAEGLARDLVRLVQQARRDAGLNVSDRIALRQHHRRAAIGLDPADHRGDQQARGQAGIDHGFRE